MHSIDSVESDDNRQSYCYNYEDEVYLKWIDFSMRDDEANEIIIILRHWETTNGISA